MFFIPTEIRIGELKANDGDHRGVVSVGAVFNVNRNVCGKKNQGFGQQLADGVLRADTVHLVLDNDLLDAANRKGEL